MFFQTHEMMNWILLDNQSSVTIFSNSDMEKNTSGREAMKLSTNGGVLETNRKAGLPEWGEVWFNPKAITNIFSRAEMADRYRMTYDSENQDAFIVHLPKQQVKFDRIGMDLNVHKWRPSKDNADSKHSQFINTVKENTTFYTQRQFERAKRARDMYHALGTPSANDFKAIIKMNAIANIPVVRADIEMAEKFSGPDIGGLKGKSTRQKPVPVVEDYIEIASELIIAQHEVTLSMDGMKVNELSFLTRISQNIYSRTAPWIPHQDEESQETDNDDHVEDYVTLEENNETILQQEQNDGETIENEHAEDNNDENVNPRNGQHSENDEIDDEEEGVKQQVNRTVTRTGRVAKTPAKFAGVGMNESKETQTYTMEETRILTFVMS